MQDRTKSFLFLGLVLLLTALSAVGYMFTKYHWGLDIKGGVQLTYQMNVKQLGPNENLEDARRRTHDILVRRAQGGLGVHDAVVQDKGADQFIIALPEYSNIDEAEKVIGTSAKIMFYDAKNVVTSDPNHESQQAYREYSEESDTTSATAAANPVVNFRRKADNKLITPKDPEYADVIKGWDYICGGDDLTKAVMSPQPNGDYWPLMNFSSHGSDQMRSWSEVNNHKGEMLAAVLDNVCISIAPVKEGAVLSDSVVTEGKFTPEYVHSLVDLLNSGALPVDLSVIASTNVDPSIGRNALNLMVTAGVVAAAVIALFMLVYYVFPGFIAVIALALYVLFTLTVLKLIDATFSLAAIAGFVLSVGMAVDANILVFERLKEEMRGGKDLHRALELGFRRALPAIVDSNACTMLTAFVLLNFGTGPVKGFATTLIIGVAISLFTAVMVTRSLLKFFVDSGIGNHPNWYGLTHQWFGESLEAGAQKKPLQVVNKAGRYFLISGLTIVPGIIFTLMGGLRGNVEFTGGTEAVISLGTSNISQQQIASSLKRHGFPDADIAMESKGSERLVQITIQQNPKINETTPNAATLIAEAAEIPPQPNAQITHVGGTIQRETISNAVYGVILSTILIILYLSMRFGFALGGFVIGWRFAASTILALIHDILVVIGLAAVMGYLLGWQVSALFISAMLTVIGFSTHDTIVIFDRIRENLRRPQPGEDAGNLINRSITQSFARSINTSMTVIVTLALLIFVGSATPELKLFNAAMLVGIISGTYSSIFNASPILYLWDVAIGKKDPNKTLLGIAALNRVRVRAPAQEAKPTPAITPATPAGTPGYSQVRRRRASDVERSKQAIDDDL